MGFRRRRIGVARAREFIIVRRLLSYCLLRRLRHQKWKKEREKEKTEEKEENGGSYPAEVGGNTLKKPFRLHLKLWLPHLPRPMSVSANHREGEIAVGKGGHLEEGMQGEEYGHMEKDEQRERDWQSERNGRIQEDGHSERDGRIEKDGHSYSPSSATVSFSYPLIGCLCLPGRGRVSHSSSNPPVVSKALKKIKPGEAFKKKKKNMPDSNTNTASSRISSSALKLTGGREPLAFTGRRPAKLRRGGRAWKPGLESIREDRSMPEALAKEREDSKVQNRRNKPKRHHHQPPLHYGLHLNQAERSISARKLSPRSNNMNWLHDGSSPLHSANPLRFMF